MKASGTKVQIPASRVFSLLDIEPCHLGQHEVYAISRPLYAGLGSWACHISDDMIRHPPNVFMPSFLTHSLLVLPPWFVTFMLGMGTTSTSLSLSFLSINSSIQKGVKRKCVSWKKKIHPGFKFIFIHVYDFRRFLNRGLVQSRPAGFTTSISQVSHLSRHN